MGSLSAGRSTFRADIGLIFRSAVSAVQIAGRESGADQKDRHRGVDRLAKRPDVAGVVSEHLEAGYEIRTVDVWPLVHSHLRQAIIDDAFDDLQGLRRGERLKLYEGIEAREERVTESVADAVFRFVVGRADNKARSQSDGIVLVDKFSRVE